MLTTVDEEEGEKKRQKAKALRAELDTPDWRAKETEEVVDASWVRFWHLRLAYSVRGQEDQADAAEVLLRVLRPDCGDYQRGARH